MIKEQIRIEAEDYIAKEKNAHFRDEVEQLLARAGTGDAEACAGLEDRFYQHLEFGTGGLRGVTGGGYNRMNTLVVRSATQGLAAYIIKTFKEKAAGKALSAVIAYDCRHYSAEFAAEAALVFAANGIKTFLFSGLRPTPELSFAVRTLKADTGIVITASHNPAQYNGYKAYWNDGSQVIPPHDAGIIKEVNAVREIKEISRDEALKSGLLKIIDKEIDEPFIKMVQSHLFRPELIKEKAAGLKVVYTPLHGTGALLVEGVLNSLGLKVFTVPEQREGNGDFPTVKLPNPEDPPALKMGIDLAKKLDAELVMATDPDADRFGIAVRQGDEFVPLTGNETGSLLLDYICLSLKEFNKLPENAVFVNTIVTTGMQKRIAASYGVRTVEVLTGFKWIADVMRRCGEKTGSSKIDGTFIFGTEESYGYLIENEVRDKDGISAAALTAEMALYWKTRGKSIPGRLEELYRIHGLWKEDGVSKYFEGERGSAIMRGILENYRKSPPEKFGGIPVVKIRDIEKGVEFPPEAPAKSRRVDLPRSDVLQFYLEDGTVVSARPSGTEPKIKFYISGAEKPGAGGLEEAKKNITKKYEAIKDDIRRSLEV